MAREIRRVSETRIYHVMLRGINKQDIFLNKNDFDMMLRSIQMSQMCKCPDGSLRRDGFYIFAYCIMQNHVHLLIMEGSLSISESMKRIQDRFVYFYNRKYERVGHLFQDRFRSEPVENADYFLTLLRYIHRNPVKAQEVARPEDYIYSSWREYLSWIKGSDPLIQLCSIDKVIRRFGQNELLAFVNEDVDDDCMDIDDQKVKMTEEAAWKILSDISGCESVDKFRRLPYMSQLGFLKSLVDAGASIRQASRLSSLPFSSLRRSLDLDQGV